ncbi:protein adenylyltransferase SelO-like isoform X3 [Sceloporus undulatus]|uniref:protein adenylyltransferase SelO-like isoform X3 n=1 Tax=Sceloporus undulatus TaxID=8520 RepID=UPI001C4C626E|nr:protein adenylyltransferase SelO-like isoform X3 [Sceloporus undulatus]
MGFIPCLKCQPLHQNLLLNVLKLTSTYGNPMNGRPPSTALFRSCRLRAMASLIKSIHLEHSLPIFLLLSTLPTIVFERNDAGPKKTKKCFHSSSGHSEEASPAVNCRSASGDYTCLLPHTATALPGLKHQTDWRPISGLVVLDSSTSDQDSLCSLIRNGPFPSATCFSLQGQTWCDLWLWDGDGRAVLHSSVREFLGSEAMHYLGIPTSRAASLVVSDDDVWRDRFYNGNVRKERGAIVLRVAKSWFRIGSLEILAHSGELDLLRMVLDHVIDEHFPSINLYDPNRYLAFFSRVVSETANLMALWMSVGFAHGVCNTDNFSLLSITIDYGPFGFMDSYDPDFVPNTSDDERRYKIGNQANVGMFNLNKLLQALNLLLAPRQKQLASQILEGYSEQYYRCFTEIFKRKLGLLGNDDEDNYLIAFLLKLMEDSRADFTMTFRQLSEISQDQLKDLSIPKEFWALQDVAEHEFFSHWVNLYLLRLKRNKGDSDFERRKRMTGINPRYVLRNWMAESAAQKAEKNDFSEVRLLQQILQFPFQAQTVAERAGYAQRPPAWAQEVKISCSS